MIPVSGNLIQVSFRHQRCSGADIAPFIVLQILNPSLEFHDHFGSLRCEKGKSLTDDINGGKESHLAA